MQNPKPVPYYDIPALGKLEIKAEEAVKWSLIKRINFYIEWTPRILNEGDINRAISYFGGLFGDTMTYMTIKGYDKEEIFEVKTLMKRIEFILKGRLDFASKKRLFFEKYKELVDLLSKYGIYVSIRIGEPKTNEEIAEEMHRLIVYADELVGDLESGEDVRHDLSTVFQRMMDIMRIYKTDDTKIQFLRNEIINKIHEAKSKVGMVVKDKPTTLDSFSKSYNETITAVNRFLVSVTTEEFVDTYFKYYKGKAFKVEEEELKEEEIAELVKQTVIRNPEFKETLKEIIKEVIIEEAGESEEAENEGEL